ncbi:MAG: polysaccharide biosynthesis tyrosine autokinase [Pseudomonadota bacterium]
MTPSNRKVQPGPVANPDTDASWSPQPLEMRTVLHLLWQRKWVITLCFLAAMVAANAYLSKLPEQFTARAEVMLNNRETRIVDIENVVSDLGSLDDSANEQRVLTSEGLLTRLIHRLRLDLDPEFNRAKRPAKALQDWRSDIEEMLSRGLLAPLLAPRVRMSDTEDSPDRERLEIMQTLRATLEVSGVPSTRAITIDVTSIDPEKAALVANTLADLYILDQLDQKFEATRQASSWLSDRVAQLKEKVRTSEAAIEAFKANQTISAGQGADLTDQQIAELNAELISARAGTAEAAARFDQVQRRIAQGGLSAASKVVSSPLILTLRTRLADLRRQEAELATRYGDKHPKIIHARAEISDAQNGVSSEVRKIVEGLKNDVAVARARESALDRSLAELEGKSVQLSRSSVELRQLEREAEADRLIYETFLSRFRETSEQEDLQSADARLLTSATAPLEPSSPNRKKVLIIAAVLGLGIGLALVAILESRANTFRAISEVGEVTGLPTLAALPRWRRRKTRQQLLGHVQSKPNSGLAEAIRTLRTALSLAQVDQPPQVVMVTSSGSGEGKSTTCLLLAQMALRAGQRPIVIDCDIRRPTLQQTFKMAPEEGLLSVLDGTSSLHDAITTDATFGLDLLPAPKPLPQAVDTFASDQFQEIIASLRERYDLILLDAPPIMLVPDAGTIGQAADTTLYAVRYDETPRAAVLEGLARLRRLNVDVAGTIATLVDVRREAQYAYAAYDAGHGAYVQKNLYLSD